MKSFKCEITVENLERLNNSYWGNPAWRVGFIAEDGLHKIGRTASNASCAYILDCSSKGKRYLCIYHYTKNDNLIITELQELKED